MCQFPKVNWDKITEGWLTPAAVMAAPKTEAGEKSGHGWDPSFAHQENISHGGVLEER